MVLPVNSSAAAIALVEAAGHDVELSKLSNPALMEAAMAPGVGYDANANSGFIFPRFLPAFDAATAFVNMLDLLAHHETTLAEVVAGLPRVHQHHASVVTPWDQKGAVMRSLMELAKGHDVDLIDGVKIHHDGGWALALPDPEEPITHVWAEAASDVDARRLAEEYVRRIRQLLR
ncbi:MAG: hypothetical protein KDB35_18865 [Acidimicrobiales bacterium]|nr:hypothetical protein [Acidimicrobiales bacterium]